MKSKINNNARDQLIIITVLNIWTLTTKNLTLKFYFLTIIIGTIILKRIPKIL